jgi:hypothetical protein
MVVVGLSRIDDEIQYQGAVGVSSVFQCPRGMSRTKPIRSRIAENWRIVIEPFVVEW